MELINFLTDGCEGLLPIVILIRNLINILRMIIPIALIAFGLIDLGKAVIAGKEDEMKKAQGTFIKRCVYALVVFLIFVIIEFVFGLVGQKEGAWKTCWNAAKDKEISDVLAD